MSSAVEESLTVMCGIRVVHIKKCKKQDSTASTQVNTNVLQTH